MFQRTNSRGDIIEVTILRIVEEIRAMSIKSEIKMGGKLFQKRWYYY